MGDYIPPGRGGNNTSFYILPDIETIFRDIRLCGCNIAKWQDQYIPDSEHHTEVFVQVLEILNADPELRKRYDAMRSGYQEAKLTEVEDNLMRLCTPGSKDSLKATQMVLTTLSDKWKKKTVETQQETPAQKYAKDLENDADV